MNNSKKKIDTTKMVGIAIFSSLAFVVALVCNVIPPVAGFLSLDVKDAIITIASFIYGPMSAVLISLIAALIELLTFSTTGWYGFVMNFASSVAFSLTASLIYKKLRSLNGALISVFSAVVLTTCVMLLLNVFVTPLYLVYIGTPKEAASPTVIGMLAKVLLPFNFAKALMNSAVVMLLYKPISRALRSTHLAASKSMNGQDRSEHFNKNTVIILSVGAATLAVAIAIILIIS